MKDRTRAFADDWVTLTKKAGIMPNEILPGCTVIFRQPNLDELDSDGKQIPMKVLEVNGERAKVEALVNMAIRPCYVHLLSELILAERHAESASGQSE